MRKFWGIGVGVGLALLMTVGTLRLISLQLLRPRLRVENFPQVRLGMSEAEVCEILGGAAGNYGRASEFRMSSLELVIPPPDSELREWWDDSNLFKIAFDQRGEVVFAYKQGFYTQIPLDEGWWSRWWRKTLNLLRR